MKNTVRGAITSFVHYLSEQFDPPLHKGQIRLEWLQECEYQFWKFYEISGTADGHWAIQVREGTAGLSSASTAALLAELGTRFDAVVQAVDKLDGD